MARPSAALVISRKFRRGPRVSASIIIGTCRCRYTPSRISGKGATSTPCPRHHDPCLAGKSASNPFCFGPWSESRASEALWFCPTTPGVGGSSFSSKRSVADSLLKIREEARMRWTHLDRKSPTISESRVSGVVSADRGGVSARLRRSIGRRGDDALSLARGSPH